MRFYGWIGFVALAAFPGCEKQEEKAVGCELYLAINYCVTLNGDTTLPDSIRIVRTTAGGRSDTLPSVHAYPKPNCFTEARGHSSLRVYVDTMLRKEIKDIFVRTVDQCHAADTLIDIRL